MGENIAPIGTLWILKSRKVWWKPWTWKNKPEYSQLAEIPDLKFSVKSNAENDYVVFNECREMSIDIKWEEKDV